MTSLGVRRINLVVVALLILFVAPPISAQTQTGRIVGTVRDSQGAVIVGAQINVANPSTSEKHFAITNNKGSYFVLNIPAASYDVTIIAPGFASAMFHATRVGVNETTTINARLLVARGDVEITISEAPSIVRDDSSELATTIDSQVLEAFPLPARNLLQLLTLAPGVIAPLTNNSAIGRNSPNVSVNGSRVTQNSYQVNGVDANDISLHNLADVGVPAPESVNEVKIQTSLYDATVAGAGGSVQVATKNGSNFLHGSVYEYFRNEALNADDANLKAVGEGRPEMRRNVYGAALGGAIRKNKAFFFLSFQGTREANGATAQSLYKSVLIAPELTTDRSTATLMKIFGVPSIDSVSLQLLNLKLPNGQFLIPTPNDTGGRVTGTALSTYHEEQGNANLDYRAGTRDTLIGKFFLAHAPLFSALSGSNFGTSASLPGFGTHMTIDNRVLSLEEIRIFSPTVVNELRFGHGFITHDELPQESVTDSSLGIQRSTASEYPGLPLILLARDQGGASIGSSDITYRGSTPSLSIGDVLSMQRGKQSFRFGGEVLHSEWQAHAAVFSYGEIDFPTFNDFLIGNTGTSQFLAGSFGFAHLGTGLTDRDFVTTDYHLFAQDDSKVSSKLTLNLGLRYELDAPPYESRGRIGGFDPALYKPLMQVDAAGFPLGPPAAGIIEAGNALARYSLAGVSRVGKRVVNSLDPNNFGPRIGLAWSPLNSGRLAIRAGYGIFYSRPSFFYLALGYFAPPFFLDSITSGQPFKNPFGTAPPESSFPVIQPGSSVAATVIDRNARTPYTQQFNTSLQFELLRDTTLQIAYVGSHGLKLFRSVAVNQAQIASLNHPVTNVVTGQTITDNSTENASLRAPLQGVSSALFLLNKSNAQSSYHSLQTSLNRAFSRGLQFSASYTFSKSIDNASNPGGGANSDGSLDRSGGFDTANVWGNQLNPRANRGLSDYDRTHYFVFSSVWNLPEPSFARGSVATWLLFSNWQVSGIVTAMSGLPVDIFDPTGGLLYGLFGARPNWAPGANAKTAKASVPAGYYFNPSAFSQAVVQPGQPIPSVHDPTAVVDPTVEAGTDIGNVGRNVLRGPRQCNVDFSMGKRFPLTESRALDLRADFFNLLNHPNRDNPVSDISTADFGKVLSFSSSPRIVQFSLKLTF